MAKKFMNNVKESFATGFGLGGGLILSFTLIKIVFGIIGLIFFIGGLALVVPQRKKSPEEQNKTKLYSGLVMMALGTIFGFTFGSELLGGFATDALDFDM